VEMLSAKIAVDEEKLADPALYTRNPAAFATLNAEIEATRAEREAAEERWLELAERVEQMAG
jgi:ABC transport system ATP-binding/permease protein